MAFGKVNEKWNHTASLMALIGACHTSADDTPPDVATYHPWLPDPEIQAVDPSILRQFGFKTVPKDKVPS